MVEQVADQYEMFIKVFFEGTERKNYESQHKGGESLLDMMATYFHAEEGNDYTYTVITFKNGFIFNSSEQVSAETMKETCMRLCPYLDN